MWFSKGYKSTPKLKLVQRLQPWWTTRRLSVIGFLFTLLALVYFIIWVFGPMIYGAWISLTNENWFAPPQFVGLTNFFTLAISLQFWHTVGRTGVYIAETVVPSLAIAFLIAWGIHLVSHGRLFFLTVFFIPFVIPTVASAIMFEMLLQPSGLVDQVLHIHISWLTNPAFAMVGLSIVTVWNLVGFYVVIFLASLQQINREVIEAAQVDGVTAWRLVWQIVLPLLRPTLLFALVTCTATVLTNFTQAYVLTNGGPGNSTLVLPLLIYRQAFTFSAAGNASAMALVLLIASIGLTYLQFKVVGNN